MQKHLWNTTKLLFFLNLQETPHEKGDFLLRPKLTGKPEADQHPKSLKTIFFISVSISKELARWVHLWHEIQDFS